MKPMNQPPRQREREETRKAKRERESGKIWRAEQRKRDERKGRKAAGERSSRRVSCDHRGVPSPRERAAGLRCEREIERVKEGVRERDRERGQGREREREALIEGTEKGYATTTGSRRETEIE